MTPGGGLSARQRAALAATPRVPAGASWADPSTPTGVGGAPISRADELVAAVIGPALKATVAFRVEQIVRHGHTVEDDAMLPIVWLPREAKDAAIAAHEAVMVHGPTRDLNLARRRLARCAALCWAAIDRIDVAIAERHDDFLGRGK